MENSNYSWFIFLVGIATTLSISAFVVKFIANLLFSTQSQKPSLPPGPSPLPLIGNWLWFRKAAEFEPVLRHLKNNYGPIISLRFGRRQSVFIGSHSLAYKSLVQTGALFSDRPVSTLPARIINSNQHNISSGAYGPTWRLLRRNLNSQVLHQSRVKSYSDARRWVLGILFRRLLKDCDNAVKVVDHFRHSMFYLLVLMCFGDKLPDQKIHEIDSVMHRVMLSFNRFEILGFFPPRLGKILFRSRWKELLELRRDQEKVLIPLIRSRIESTRIERGSNSDKKNKMVAYLDTLVDLHLPEDNDRKPNEGELVSMCSELLNAGTDTTSAALQWIIANLVKNPTIQEKLYKEIVQVLGHSPTLKINEGEDMEMDMKVVEEEDLERMPYLKAIVLEGLRRHPPGHFLLPHTVTEDVELDGYLIPKKTMVNFLVGEMGLDPDVWEDPMEFKPERFLAGDEKEKEKFDITCTREIKMMPFGAGRRMCPGANLAMLHLEYFVANLVWYFEWKEVVGQEVDFSEKQEFSAVMKNPLNAHISPRAKFV